MEALTAVTIQVFVMALRFAGVHARIDGGNDGLAVRIEQSTLRA